MRPLTRFLFACREGLDLALAAPKLERLAAAMILGDAYRLDVIGRVDLLEADEAAFGTAQQIEPIINHIPPARRNAPPTILARNRPGRLNRNQSRPAVGENT